jgi:hypothetical protein
MSRGWPSGSVLRNRVEEVFPAHRLLETVSVELVHIALEREGSGVNARPVPILVTELIRHLRSRGLVGSGKSLLLRFDVAETNTAVPYARLGIVAFRLDTRHRLTGGQAHPVNLNTRLFGESREDFAGKFLVEGGIGGNPLGRFGLTGCEGRSTDHRENHQDDDSSFHVSPP